MCIFKEKFLEIVDGRGSYKADNIMGDVLEKLLTQHISGPVTKYKLLYVSNQGRARVRAGDRAGLEAEDPPFCPQSYMRRALYASSEV